MKNRIAWLISGILLVCVMGADVTPWIVDSGGRARPFATGDTLVGAGGGGVIQALQGGRLSGSTTDPLFEGTYSSITLTPYLHDQIGLWTGSEWEAFTYTSSNPAALDVSVSLGSSDFPYDLFVNNSTGTTLVFSVEAWASATARNSSLSYLNGVRVLSSDNEKRYLGTIAKDSSSGESADQPVNRLVWRENHRVSRGGGTNTALGNYSLIGAVGNRPLGNNDGVTRMKFVIGNNTRVSATYSLVRGDVPADTNLLFGFGLDSTTVIDAANTAVAPATALQKQETMQPLWSRYLSDGYYKVSLIENQGGSSPGTTAITVSSSNFQRRLQGEW